MKMNARTVLSKLAEKPANTILTVTDWMLGVAETHWANETNRLQGSEGYSSAFNSWFTVRVIRQRIRQPVRLVGGEHIRVFKEAA